MQRSFRFSGKAALVEGATHGISFAIAKAFLKEGEAALISGKSSVHNLEVEDLRALTFYASAFTGVKMAGIDRACDC